MVNYRQLKCGKVIIAIGQDWSKVDLMNKASKCLSCDHKLCEYREDYLKGKIKD